MHDPLITTRTHLSACHSLLFCIALNLLMSRPVFCVAVLAVYVGYGTWTRHERCPLQMWGGSLRHGCGFEKYVAHSAFPKGSPIPCASTSTSMPMLSATSNPHPTHAPRCTARPTHPNALHANATPSHSSLPRLPIRVYSAPESTDHGAPCRQRLSSG